MSESPSTDIDPQPTAENDRLAMPVDHEQPPHLRFPVVGIGASAGGLEAFIEFFENVRPGSGIAYVLIQHLPPERESLVAEILSTRSKIPVQEVKDGVVVEPDHAYVIRPGRTLTILNGYLHLGEPVEKRGHQRPVDDFFRSLAAEQRERSICILLSGMGSNGTAGAREIKTVGGLCIAQDPETAKFPQMPRSLIQAGLADYIFKAAEMPDVLLRYTHHPYATGATGQISDGARDRAALADILASLRTRTRMDFSGYKKATIIRRIQRRMGVNQLTGMLDYAKLLRQLPGEIATLAEDLLIHVTGFFRDPEVWAALDEQVIRPLMESRADESPIRAWVTACSTGEEAFTLAMLLTETAADLGKHFDIKVFATDKADRSLHQARAGIYAGGIESEVTAERLERFFTRDGPNYRVSRDLREKVVFAAQNVLQDPPFSKLDLCTCRNLLIYLEPETQLRVLATIHFGLREGGALLLGNSETISGAEELYEPIDKKHRIFRRTGASREVSSPFPLPRLGAPDGTQTIRSLASSKLGISQLAQEAFLARYAPAGVAIDRDAHIVYFQGDTHAFFQSQRGEPTRDLFILAREHVRVAARTAVLKALATNEGAVVLHEYTDSSERQRLLQVEVTPLTPGLAKTPYFLVGFTDRAHDAPAYSPDAGGADAGPQDTQSELQRLRGEVQLLNDQLMATTQEMRASNEESTSVNEELQSINEELETSKEELQSLNEELSTVNAQLQNKMHELEETSNDLTSLLSSTHIAVLFLDPHFRIRRYTPAVSDLVDLIPADVGRSLSALARKFSDPELDDDVSEVLASLMPKEAEVTSHSGRTYVRRALPYRTSENRIEGVVVTFVEITDRKRVEQELQATERQQRLILEGVKEYAIFTLDAAGRMKTWTTAAERVLGFTATEVLDKSLSIVFTPEDLVDGLPDQQLAEAREKVSVAEEHWYVRRSGERFWGSGMLYALKDPDGTATGFINILRDNTERRRAEEFTNEARRIAERSNEAKDHFLANVSHELRTPLSGMMLWSRLLLQQEELDPVQLREGLESIQKCAHEQQAIIEDLVDTSRIAAGKMKLERAPIDLVATLRSTVDAIRLVATGRGLTLAETYDPAIGIVFADGHRLHQVVSNLLSNAAKFTPEGGNVALIASRKDDRVVIKVTDTGQGIRADLLKGIFERFRQGDNPTTKTNRGLGLGLAIVLQLVELHGGSIVATSSGPGRGSTFTVSLPLPALRDEQSDAQRGAAMKEAKIDLAGLRVLVVEDSVETLNALKALLQDAGAVVSTAASAVEARKKFEVEVHDLLVSDLGLPNEDGNALLAQIRAWEKQQRRTEIPAIAVTAYADEPNRIRALKSGFSQCLTKPINPAKFLATLSKFKANRTDRK